MKSMMNAFINTEEPDVLINSTNETYPKSSNVYNETPSKTAEKEMLEVSQIVKSQESNKGKTHNTMNLQFPSIIDPRNLVLDDTGKQEIIRNNTQFYFSRLGKIALAYLPDIL